MRMVKGWEVTNSATGDSYEVTVKMYNWILNNTAWGRGKFPKLPKRRIYILIER